MKITLKKAEWPDIEFLYWLRNQDNILKFSKNNKKVRWEEHINWIIPIILGVVNKDIYIIREKNMPVGQVRFDYLPGKRAVISISIAKEFRSKGFATMAIKEGICLVREGKRAEVILAEVHKDNLISQRLFEKLEFKLKKINKEWLNYSYDRR